LDEEADEIIKEHDINVSRMVRQELKSRYRSVEMLKEKREQLESKKREIVNRKHELEKKKNDIEDRLRRIDQAITRNSVFQQIEDNKKYKKKVEQRVATIKKAKADGDSQDQIKHYIERNAEILVEQDGLPFEKDDVEEILELLCEI